VTDQKPTDPRDSRKSSQKNYKKFVGDYKAHRLDELIDAQNAALQRAGHGPEPAPKKEEPETDPKTGKKLRISRKRREYIRLYLRWLKPHRGMLAGVIVLAILLATFEMVEPLFMRAIIDKVLLNPALDTPGKFAKLNLIGGAFLAFVILSRMFQVGKDYRQRILNTKVILSLRRALYDRMLHLPLPKLWELKTGGILSRLTGDVETTTGLLQMAVISPSLSVLRLLIALGILLSINWRLALTALAVIPGAMFISFTASKRVRPIYRSVRKDVELIDGRVGETFSGIRVVRAFTGEVRELLDYMTGRHTVLRKELFAHRRELLLWTSWGLIMAAVNVIII
jgi:ATP-binding cassette subfamily B protein/subfamily B ATP-binding cassette protein MsbA